MVGKNAERMIIAALLSFVVYGGTWYWYKSTGTQLSSTSNAKPIAFVDNVREDVQRRPVEMLIWQMLSGGEPLYPGEVIRTNANSEVRIQFAEGDRYIDLDPDTEIIISQSSDEVSLDLMKGGLFVKQGEGGGEGDGPALTLNSGKGKVDLSQATASLSKADGANLNVQVLKGTAKIESDGQSKELNSGKSGGIGASGAVFDQAAIQILSPSLEKPSYINPENITPVQFSWKGLPAGAQVQLFAGTSRKNLKPLGLTTAENPSSIMQTIKPGKYFWKLVAKNPADQSSMGESPIYRLQVASLFAPTPLAPENEGFVQLSKKEDTVTFKWFKPEDTISVYVEVSDDAEFKNKIITKNVTEGSELSQTLASGDYYWRISGSYEGVPKPVVSKAIKFTVSNKPKIERQPLVIGWLSPDDGGTVYFNEAPAADLSWKSDRPEEVTQWKIQIADMAEDAREPASENIKVVESLETRKKVSVEKAGKYWAIIEAYDKDGNLLGKSPPKIFLLSPSPLLAAPQFIPAEGDLKADNNGKVVLNWNKIEGAKEYVVSFLDKDGKKIREAKFTGNTTSLVNLLPGTYNLEISAVDQKGRAGDRSPARALLVPETSGLQAPKLRKIKVN